VLQWKVAKAMWRRFLGTIKTRFKFLASWRINWSRNFFNKL
jgi:hypothetical protein